jgi:hypothetical protein
MQGKDGDKMNKNITLMSSCLLLISSRVFADRPAMEDSSPVTESEVPAAAQESNHRPEPTPVSAVDLSIQQESTSATQQHTGDALEIQPGETLPINALDFPRRGMAMSKVQNELGQPSEISETVGEPPITSWIYADRTVYFEHSNVVHVVANH